MNSLVLPASPEIDTPVSSITLRLLGPAQILLNGSPLRFPYDHVLALLVYLAVESDRSHRRSALAGLLWPEQPERAARHSLSQALFTLRRLLHDDADEPLIHATRDAVRFNSDGAWCDVVIFRSFLDTDVEKAIALYNGEFLQGLGIAGSAEFEEWALVTREQLREQVCAALKQLTEPERWADAVKACGYARRWIELDPLHEEAHRRAMVLLARTGQRAAALRQFERCRDLLQTELGVTPEPETLALYEELKQRVSPSRPQAILWSTQLPPLPPTRLIGCDRDLEALAALLAVPANRLITITGPGGVGKTRLALHAAVAAAPTFADGLRYVPLAAVREPTQELAAIAQALGIQQTDTCSLAQLVGAALAEYHILLVLDNCEHLLPSLSAIVADLLRAAPHLVILATSRTTLHLSSEHRFSLAPLSLAGGDDITNAVLVQPAAVELFVERAQAVRPLVELDYGAIHAICKRLDGLPLAIELAANRTRLLNPHDLLLRLEQRLPLLNGGPRDLPERQQTLRGAIEWSYQLLEPRQQALLRRLSVFAGGWTVAAAEAIVAEPLDAIPAPTNAIDDLVALLDASLIIELPDGAGEPRCTMLETIREYGHEQLVAHGELPHAQAIHAQLIAELAAQTAAKLSSADQSEWLRRLDSEFDNVRAALRWCSMNDSGTGLRIASDLSRYWDIRGYWREGHDWLKELLDATRNTPPPTAEERAAGLLVVGILANCLNDFAPATTWLGESLALYQQLGNQQKLARVLNILGNVELGHGAYYEAEQYYRESLILRRTLGHTVGMASTLNNLAMATCFQGDLPAAKAYYDESLSLYRQLNDRAAEALVQSHIADVLLLQGEHRQAQRLHETSHAIAQELGYKPGLQQALNGLGDVARSQKRLSEAKHLYQQSMALAGEIHDTAGIARNMFCLAVIAWAEKCPERTAMLLSTAAALNHNAHTTLPPEDIVKFEQHVEWTRAVLGAAMFERAWTSGHVLSLEQAVALALDESF